jgi:hypothetical protein
MAAAERGSWWGHLRTLILFAIMGGIFYEMHRREQDQSRQEQRATQVAQNAREAVLARGDFGEMLRLCREGWNGIGLWDEPVAMAWTRRGIDAYFLQGPDTTSVRQVRCDGQGVRRGPRVDRPLRETLPAEAAREPDKEAEAAWAAAISGAATQKFGPGDVAFELLRHPFTGAVLSRRWSGGPEGATATLDPKGAPSFAFLPAERFPAVGKAPPALRSRERKHWLTQDAAAFALLTKELPKGARVSELRIDEGEINVTIDWKTPNFNDRPPAPYGEKTFDECGIAHMDYWYPREIPGSGCAAGTPLADVYASYGLAKAQRGSWPVTIASYSCSNGPKGVWRLTPSADD